MAAVEKRGVAESYDQALHQPDQQRRHHHAPERAQTADHHDNERRRDDFLPHSRMHGVDGREQHAREARKPDAQRCDSGHVWLERDAERADHVGILHAGTHHAAERVRLQQEPKPGHAQDRDTQKQVR